MRVALTNNFFPPIVSGSAHFTEELARNLTRRGVEVLVVTASHHDATDAESRDGYQIVRLPSWPLPKTPLSFKFDISLVARSHNFRRLRSVLDAFSPDVLHQHGQFFDLTFMSSIWARNRKKPTVLSVHTRLEHPSAFYRRVLAIADRTAVRCFMGISNPYVIVGDAPMKEYIDRRYRVPQDHLVPIPVGVEPLQVSREAGQAARERLGVGDRPMILSLGHVIPLRNRLALIEALPLLLEKRPDARVVVVGHVYDDRFMRRAAELGVEESIILTGSAPKDEALSYLSAADVEIHDLQGLGLGKASLEALAAGVPVVATVRADNFLGVKLESWENIVLVPPDAPSALAEAAIRLLDDPELARRIAERERDLIRAHFTLDAVTDAHVALYERLRSMPHRDR
jgi:glycosyltransferase involved in cell wall biosynthesis